MGSDKYHAMNPTQKLKTSSLVTRGGLWIAFLIFAVLTALVSYTQLRAFFLQYNVTSLPGLALVNSPTVVLNEQGTPISTPVPGVSTGPVPDRKSVV